MINWCFSYFVLILVASTSSAEDEGLAVYSAVPGLEPSPFYEFRLRQVGEETGEWLDTFALVTECTDAKFCNTTSQGEKLGNWSNTYINFQMGSESRVEVEVTKLWADGDIVSAVVHPAAAAEGCEVMGGKAYCVIHKQGLFTIDINGQMDEQDTGKLPDGSNYEGPPIHTLTVFANPFIEDEPDIFGEGVLAIEPGEEVPTEGNWETLYFLPGLHHVGLDFRLHSNRSYYIPGDAVLYGTMNNGERSHNEDGSNIRIFGHGTLSGDFLPHPNYADPPVSPEEHYKYHHINLFSASNTFVEGITLANSPSHSLSLADRPESNPTSIRWVKIFTWRANGDGIGLNKNTLLEDSFIRTQDDSSYVGGRGIHRVVYWNDANGSTFVMAKIGNDWFEDHDIVVEDCTVVYARRMLPAASPGGRVFAVRGQGGGEGGTRLTFRNIVIEDPRPTTQPFLILMEAFEPYGKPEEMRREPGDMHGILFQNITIVAASNVLGEQDVLWGFDEGRIYDLTFDNVVIGGKLLDSQDHFLTNEFVYDLKFVG